MLHKSPLYYVFSLHVFNNIEFRNGEMVKSTETVNCVDLELSYYMKCFTLLSMGRPDKVAFSRSDNLAIYKSEGKFCINFEIEKLATH